MPTPRRPQPIRVYSHLLEPREHPDYRRRAVQPPSWDTFEGRTHFTALRSFEIKDDRIVNAVEEIELYTRTHALGDIIWPSYPVLFAKNLGELADEIKRRGLYLFDIWGYVPGSGPGGYWTQFKAPPEQLALLSAKLGERWFGTDIGEQDGRYISLYAAQLTPVSGGRFEQYLNFQRHFERMGDDLGHRHATLVSLNFGHYFLKEGTYTLIGAETAQALPNSQVYYAFIRGAGKQYGVPWFGNASVYNRWGYKSYGTEGRTEYEEYGPTKGSSLSLLKRLLYTHVLYNSVFVGFENNWIEAGKITPLGLIQQAAQRWVKAHGQPGVMHTPVALLLDFHSGWSFPRHLYTSNVYRVWGNLPYGAGDYLTDAVIDLLYPGYQDSSYFHDESGFNVPTPYGDIADCLLSDAAAWLLARYPVLVVAGELSGGQELRDKLEAYVEAGGHLVLTAGNLAKLPGGIAGLTTVKTTTDFRHGRGRVTLFASAFGVKPVALKTPLKNEVDRPLAKPFVLVPEVRRKLGEIFSAQQLFVVEGEGLSVVTCRKARGEYVVGIANNGWRATPFQIVSRCGRILAQRELTLDDTEKTAVGYLPESLTGSAMGTGSAEVIAGGDMRIFAVRVAERGVAADRSLVPAPRPTGRWLTLRGGRSIKEELLARPTFFEHFDGVVVDWRYFNDREIAVLRAEAGWIRRQGLQVVADLSSGLNLYPTLRLIDAVPDDYAASMAVIEQLLGKLELLGAKDLIFSLHRLPENNITAEEAEAALMRGVQHIAQQAAVRGITLHLRLGAARPPKTLANAVGFLDKVAAPNLKLAPSLALLLEGSDKPAAAAVMLKDRVGLWLAAGIARDAAGVLWDTYAPVRSLLPAELKRLNAWRALAPSATPIVFDAILRDHDAEYLDARVLAPKQKSRR